MSGTALPSWSVRVVCTGRGRAEHAVREVAVLVDGRRASTPPGEVHLLGATGRRSRGGRDVWTERPGTERNRDGAVVLRLRCPTCGWDLRPGTAKVERLLDAYWRSGGRGDLDVAAIAAILD